MVTCWRVVLPCWPQSTKAAVAPSMPSAFARQSQPSRASRNIISFLFAMAAWCIGVPAYVTPCKSLLYFSYYPLSETPPQMTSRQGGMTSLRQHAQACAEPGSPLKCTYDLSDLSESWRRLASRSAYVRCTGASGSPQQSREREQAAHRRRSRGNLCRCRGRPA